MKHKVASPKTAHHFVFAIVVEFLATTKVSNQKWILLFLLQSKIILFTNPLFFQMFPFQFGNRQKLVKLYFHFPLTGNKNVIV